VIYKSLMGEPGERGQIAGRAAAFSFATGISRLFGLGREMVLAYLFGAGYAMDAFRVAFNVPNLLRDFFGEGTLNAAFIPVFSSEHVEKGKEDALRFANTVLNFLILFVSVICVLCVLFAPWLMRAVALGFTRDPDKIALTWFLARIIFPFLVLVAISALMMGVLNYFKRFFVPAVAPAFFNVGVIGCAILLYRFLPSAGWDPITSVALGVVAGGLLQVLIQIPLLRRVGFRYRFEMNLGHPGLRKVLVLVLPVVAGLAATRINVLINTFLATLLEEGSVSYLSYSFRLMQLPIGLFGVAVASVSLPKLSEEASRGQMDMVRSTFSYSMRLVFTLTIPASVLTAVLARPICSLLYERGNFTHADTIFTSQALIFYSLTILGAGASKVLASTFYSLKRPKTPMKISFLCVAANIALNLILMWSLRFRAMALSTSVASILNMALLFVGVRSVVGPYDKRAIASTGVRILIASVMMGAAAWAGYSWLLIRIDSLSLASRAILVIIPLALGGTAFLVLSRLMGIVEVQQLIRDLRDRLRRV